MASSNLPVLPLAILGGGALLFLYLSSNKSSSAPPSPAPLPSPIPGPSTLPNSTQLLSQLTTYATMMAANPQSVDPAQLDALATQFDVVGLPLQAQAARDLATAARNARQGPAPPPPPPPNPSPAPLPIDVLMASFNSLLAQAAIDPNSVDPDTMDYVAAQLDMANYPQQAATLRAAATQVRKSKAGA